MDKYELAHQDQILSLSQSFRKCLERDATNERRTNDSAGVHC